MTEYILDKGVLRLRKRSVISFPFRPRIGLWLILRWFSSFCFRADRTLRLGSEAERKTIY